MRKQKQGDSKKHKNDIYRWVHAYIHTAIMIRFLISQVWRERNTEINVHLCENASDSSRQKTSLKNFKWQTNEED